MISVKVTHGFSRFHVKTRKENNARQRSDNGSVLYERKFGLSSSRCFVLICLGEKICVGVLVIERYY